MRFHGGRDYLAQKNAEVETKYVALSYSTWLGHGYHLNYLLLNKITYLDLYA